MYAMWPGYYSFRDETKFLPLWLKEQTEAFILKVYEIRPSFARLKKI